MNQGAFQQDTRPEQGGQGKVCALYIRSTRGAEPVGVESAQALADLGLHGDVHSDPLSLRQVLLVNRSVYWKHGLRPGTLRENILVDLDEKSQLEPGTLIEIGPTASFWLTFPCEPCGRLNRHQPGLMKAIGKNRGVLARVLKSGHVAVGDEIRVIPGALRGWPLRWQDRIAAILRSVPEDQVVEYAHLARLAGVPVTYCRVFPKLIGTLTGFGEPSSVPSGANPLKARWSGAEIFSNPYLSSS